MLLTGLFESAEAYSSFSTIGIRALTIGVIAYAVLNGWLLHTRGQTVGKAMLGLVIVDNTSGKKASLWKLLLIRMWFFPSLLLLGITPYAIVPFIDHAMIFTPSRRCLHDRICGTSVIKMS